MYKLPFCTFILHKSIRRLLHRQVIKKGMEEGTDTDTMEQSPSKGRKRSPSKGRDRKESLSLNRRHKDRRERKTKSPNTVRYRQENAAHSDSIDVSLSSETDSERGRPAMVYHLKHILKPPKFDGVRSFKNFWAQFCNCVKHNKWNRQQQLAYLRSALEGETASILLDYGDEVTGSLTQLSATLKKRFDGKALADKYRIEIRNWKRRPKKTLQALHANIRRMAALYFPSVKHQIQKVMATDYFLNALRDPELALKTRERNPENLDAVLRIALQLKVWTKDSYRLQQKETPRPTENKKSRKITKTCQPSALKKKNKALQKKIAKAKKTVEDIKKAKAETKKDMEKTRKKMAELKARTARPPPVTYAGDVAGNVREPPLCFRCEDVGHYIRACPNRLPGGTAPRTYAPTTRSEPIPNVRPIA